MTNSDTERMIAIAFSAILFRTSTAAILCALRASDAADNSPTRHYSAGQPLRARIAALSSRASKQSLITAMMTNPNGLALKSLLSKDPQDCFSGLIRQESSA